MSIKNVTVLGFFLALLGLIVWIAFLPKVGFVFVGLGMLVFLTAKCENCGKWVGLGELNYYRSLKDGRCANCRID